MQSDKPYFLVSDHAVDRRGNSKNKCLKELKHCSKEIAAGLARPLLGRAGLRARRFPHSRFWVVNNEWMYISQAGRSPGVEIVTTCIHIFDRTRQAILRGEPIPNTSAATAPLPDVLSNKFRESVLRNVTLDRGLLDLFPEGDARDEFKDDMLFDFSENQVRASVSKDTEGNPIKLIRTVSGDGANLHLSFVDGWQVKFSKGIHKAFPHSADQENLTEIIREAHLNGETLVELESGSEDYQMQIQENRDKWALKVAFVETTNNTPLDEYVTWVKLTELE
jgi:hypothetical protein